MEEGLRIGQGKGSKLCGHEPRGDKPAEEKRRGGEEWKLSRVEAKKWDAEGWKQERLKADARLEGGSEKARDQWVVLNMRGYFSSRCMCEILCSFFANGSSTFPWKSPLVLFLDNSFEAFTFLSSALILTYRPWVVSHVSFIELHHGFCSL